MGSRGAFVSVSTGDFSFKAGGQNYLSLGTLSTDENVKIIMQTTGSVKAPEYSHTPGRIYAVIQNGYLKHLSYYDAEHNQVRIVDLLHQHGPNRLKPHVHLNLKHDDIGIEISSADEEIINRIKKEYKLK